MTEERREIAQKYVHDMINSFVEDPHSANYHGEYNPPYISFYSPDIEGLLEKACYEDKFLNAHKELAVLYDFDPHIYDIEGHRVRTLKGMIDINIDGVAFDQNECKWLETTTRRRQSLYLKWLHCKPRINKYQIRLPK